MFDFKGAHYPKSVILFAVFFYLRYPVSYRDLEEIMQERGVDVDHATLNRWVINSLHWLPLRRRRKSARRPSHGGWMKPISKCAERGCITTALWTGTANPLILCYLSGVTSRRRGVSSGVQLARTVSPTVSLSTKVGPIWRGWKP